MKLFNIMSPSITANFGKDLLVSPTKLDYLKKVSKMNGKTKVYLDFLLKLNFVISKCTHYIIPEYMYVCFHLFFVGYPIILYNINSTINN